MLSSNYKVQDPTLIALSHLLDFALCSSSGHCGGDVLRDALGQVLGVPTSPGELVKAAVDLAFGNSPVSAPSEAH